jgi:arginyl-tRNA synthetase
VIFYESEPTATIASRKRSNKPPLKFSASNSEQFAAEVPPKTELGDLAFPVAFELAKQIKQQTGEKQNPREIAEKLKAALENSISSNASKSRARVI